MSEWLLEKWDGTLFLFGYWWRRLTRRRDSRPASEQISEALSFIETLPACRDVADIHADLSRLRDGFLAQEASQEQREMPNES